MSAEHPVRVDSLINGVPGVAFDDSDDGKVVKFAVSNPGRNISMPDEDT